MLKIKNDFILILILVFVLFRPIVSTELLGSASLFGISIREAFGLGMSYCFLLSILVSGYYKKLDASTITIMAYIIYILSSALWGSQLREVIRLVLPPFAYFAARHFIDNERKLRLVYTLFVIGFILPILISFIQIIRGDSAQQVIYWTGLVRFSGIYSHTHPLGHEMFVFLFICLLLLINLRKTPLEKKLYIYLIYILWIIGVFNLYRSYVRTVYIGFATMISFYLIAYRRYKTMIVMFIIAIGIMTLSDTFHMIIYDIIEPLQGKRSIEWLGSGRIGAWLDLIKQFLKLPFERYFLGAGIGNEIVLGRVTGFGASHNDYLSLLYSTGILGISIYIGINLIFIKDIIQANTERNIKYIYLGFIASVFIMNLLSNSYISRFEMAQYFYFIIGTFYAIRNFKYIEKENSLNNVEA